MTALPTTALYDEDPRMFSFEGRVLSCEPAGDGTFAVILDRTAFFPEQGGQTGDRGTLAAVKEDGEESRPVAVLDTQIKDEVIRHLCAMPLPEGTRVRGEIDAERRLDFMRNHSAEHLYSGILFRQYGIRNFGFHLSDAVMTADYEAELSPELVREVEEKVNRAVMADVPVQVRWLTGEEKNTLSYRSKKEIEGAVRLVTFPGFDDCACCAPHVARTGEIGLMKVVSAVRYKKGTRVTMAAGLRAFRLLSEGYAVIRGLAASLSTKEEEVPAQVAKLKEKNRELAASLSAVRTELLMREAEALPADADPALIFGTDLPDAAMRRAVNAMMGTRAGLCGVFSRTENGCRFVLGRSSGGMKETAGKLRERLRAGCGGDDRMASGSVRADEAAIREVLA